MATVWRLNEVFPAVAEMARVTGTIALIDLSHLTMAAAAAALRQGGVRGEGVHLKMAPEALNDPSLPELLESLAIKGLWVEFHPLLLDESPHQAIGKLTALAPAVEVFPILSDATSIFEALERHPSLPNLVLKGCEASGLVGKESIFTLYATVKDRLRSRESAPGLVIWGGVAAPEAAAAFLTTGSQGIVFESLHWLTDLARIAEAPRQGLAKLRPDHTQLVGVSVDAPHRVFNKGNSLAVKKLQELAASGLTGSPRERGRAFIREVAQAAIAPQESRFHREELIPLGVEAAFAQDFVTQYGSKTREALEGFLKDIAGHCARAQEKEELLGSSPTAREMGTRYPLIQGAMSWITDVPEFALAVAEAGGLPTVALGLMDQDALNRKLKPLPEIMEDRPYAVNVIALAENPHRDSQVAWIIKQRPRFAVIAAGEPSFAEVLRDQGIEVIYIAPNEDLLRLACAAGVRYLILEGNEAGGHVGQHTTLTLAQIALALKRKEPHLLEGRHLVLAGGIYNRETAFMAAMLGADALQMGTVYLATSEIVATGALTPLYQRLILESSPGGTAVSGECSGLRVRSLKTPMLDRVSALERDFQEGRQDESSFRKEMETLAAGSLLVAARGTNGPEGARLPEASCVDKGQFMSGACAGAIAEVKSVAELHRELAEGPLSLTQPELGAPRPAAAMPHRPPAHRTNGHERIAVTGMSVVNSLGNSPAEVWAAAMGMKCGITLVPPERWDHPLYYHPRPRMPEKTYCKVGAFHHLDITRKDLGIPPQDFRTMTQATKLTLWLAAHAIEESGILSSDIPRERIAVLISQNSGEAAGTLADLVVGGAWETILNSIQRVMPLSPEMQEAITKEVKAGRLAIDDTTLLGRLNCTAGGYISGKYGLMGPSFAVSAACATSLVALFNAIQMVRNGIIDAAIVGGGEENLTPMHFLEFSALGALAGITGEEYPPWESSRPFDLTRDGMVLGEGGGMIIIERESAAKRRGARVHAYLTGTGASNNHLGLVESSRDTQEIAIRNAFQDIPYRPDGVDLVECHATATFQGDVEEVKALQAFYQGNGRTVLSSFKSQIGHTLGASGLNSLIRGVMAMQTRVFPPTLNYRNPDPEMGIEESGLLVPTEPMDWPAANGRPRRLQVNSFGFGGSNYVMHLEESLDQRDIVLVAPDLQPAAEPDQEEKGPDGVFCGRTTVNGHAYRVAVTADSEAEALTRIQEMDPISPNGPLPEKTLRVLGRKGIFLGLETAAAPPLALVFPGQGAQYAGMGHELYKKFPIIREYMDRAMAVADFDLLDLMFNNREEDLQKTRWQQPATFTLEYSMVQHLLSLGIKPAAMAGHSLGELTALATSGVFSFEDGFRLVNQRAICMDKACLLNLDPGIMIATDMPLELVEAKVKALHDVFITNYNAPNQIVIGGETNTVQALRLAIKEDGYRATQLKVSMSFHSPIMRVIHDEMLEFITPLPFHAPKIPVISNTTKEPFPADPAEIKRIVMAHLESPVQWISNVRTLWNDFGIRVFLEVGPGDALSNLITETLESPQCIPTCLPEGESQSLTAATAQLIAEGHLPGPRTLKFTSLPTVHGGRPPAAAKTPAAAAGGFAPAALQDPVERILQREVNAFVLESFGRFLKPSLLSALRREHDPNFSEESLDQWLHVRKYILGSTLGATADLLAPGAQAAAPAAAPAAAAPEGAPDYLEEVILLIMEATGYERDEIEPDMDLRTDLAIRSSRLPVIMDAAETRFGIEIRLEDFMDVRTVRELATRIAEVAARSGEPAAAREGAKIATAPEKEAAETPLFEGEIVKRLTFHPVPLADFDPHPLELTASDTVAILCPGAASAGPERVNAEFSKNWGVKTQPMSFLDSDSGGFDLRQPEEAHRLAAALRGDDSLAGVAFILDGSLTPLLKGIDDLPRVVQGCFAVVQALLDAPRKKFALALNFSPADAGEEGLLAQGLLGLFLSAALENPGLLFRTVELDQDADLSLALRQALDPAQPVVETIYRQGRLLTMEGKVTLTPGAAGPVMTLGPEDVVVFSGGGYGITPHLVKGLAPFKPRIVILGRTDIELAPETVKLLLAEEPSGKALRWQIMQQRPEISQDELGKEIARLFRVREVLKTLEDLRASGLEVSYLSCDVANPARVQAAVREIIDKYGKIDGIVHAAGIVRDRLLPQLAPEDIAGVLDVKFLGAWNLYHAAQTSGLRFLVALSSAAAIQGNRGQSNYTAANRMMSGLLSKIKLEHPEILCKALMLPPISGSGMAENEEVRLFLEKMGVGYFEPVELEELFCRELFLGAAGEVWVMFMSRLPEIKQVRLAAAVPASASPGLHAATLAFSPEQFPMIDAVSQLSLKEGAVLATRTFSQEKDPWIADHKPFKFLKHPLVSTIMALETFMEASRLVFPYLRVQGIKDAQFMEVIEVSPEVAIMSYITCRRRAQEDGRVVCDLTMETPLVSPTGRVLERKALNYRAQVILGAGISASWLDLPGFPVNQEELDSRPAEIEEIFAWYGKHTDMQGRYRVVGHLDGSGPGVVRGSGTFKITRDFTHVQTSVFQYSPYILESLMQMTSFFLKMRNEEDARTVIPVGIGEMLVGRQCREQEIIIMEARLRTEDDKGMTWDAQAVDADGQVLMQVKDLRMRWFSE
ncbi:MAG: SDR family NAD(P)-dependent oxidoreductase [Deltaproteobacteria bacterium]|nr:MAG: SDR family NAD(P)-dependent oxidoreductase [Deltaproteobacteria bacterium]